MQKNLLKLIILLSAVILIVAGCSFSQTEKGRVKWNFLVYLDGDNDLEPQAISTMNEIEKYGSTDDVNVLVLVDRIPGYDTSNGDWTGTRLYYITQDSDTSIINSMLVENLGEMDLSDPDSLQAFIVYCDAHYPASQTVLTVWNHGGGYEGICWDETLREILLMTA